MNESFNQPFEEKRSYLPFNFTGEGSRFFGIWAVNIVLTIITLGLYYPWAKAATRKYMWNETVMDGDRFVFHGTGKEMFRGFIFAYGIIVSMIALIFIFPLGILLFYVGLLLLGPIAIFGGWKYRMSRTSWRGIFFSFKGEMGEFLKLYYISLFFTIITLGIYGSWMRVKIMEYLFGHTQIGDYKLSFTGEGSEFFGINLKGIFFALPTLYIYLAWFAANRFNFTVRNINIESATGKHRLFSKLKGADVLGVLFVNALLLIVTLGLAFPWCHMRVMKLYMSNMAIPSDLDLTALQQDADNFKDATGDDLMDILDVGLEF